ncbi:MAG: hypothetical protein IJG36_10940 [Synergistaceae bacterium]|nr:hypothetical protein [Synergistaceae bacterium]
MRKKSRKQLQDDAEQEYYEKLLRQERWQTIKSGVEKLSLQLKGLQRDYCDCLRCSNAKYNSDYFCRYGEYPPDYEEHCARCREESRIIQRLIDEMSGLQGITEEGYSRYGELNPVRPLHLP